MTNLEDDLARIGLQEEKLQFQSFDAETAWTVGSQLREAALARGAAVAVDIQLNGHTLFFTALRGATPDNGDWIRRKRNVVLRFQRSSYAVGLELRKQGTTLEEKLGIDTADFAAHGGCFPILLRGTGCVGTITVSGLPQREDHELIVEVLAAVLGIPLEELKLDSR